MGWLVAASMALPATVIFKGVKPPWKQEFWDERKVYEQLKHRQGWPLAICFGIATY
jgi:hypothetical protein